MTISNPEFDDEQARQFWESGQRDEAIRCWRRALEANPGCVEALTSLAWALEQQEDVEGALALARRAVELLPTDPAGRRVLGELLFLQGNYAEAVDHYLAGIRCSEDGNALLTTCLHRDLGDALYMMGHFREAADEYQKALSAGGDEAYCHLWLGWTRQQLGDRDGAMSEFQAACEMAPDWHEAFYAAGQLSCTVGQYLQAREYLEQGLPLYPTEDEEGRAAATCELGNAHRGLGDATRAVELYTQALSLDPTHPVARFNLGLAYSELGNHEAALATFDVAAQFDPDDADICVERGRACLELGRHDKALEAYRAALDLSPESAEAYSGLGITYYSLGIYDTSAEHYRKAVEFAPGDPWPHYNLALALDAAGRHADADADMEVAWKLGQDDCDACIAIARALTSQGRDPSGAARSARRACGLDPQSAEAHGALAAALHSAGNYAAALGPAREAVRLMPEAAEYHYDLGLIHESLRDLSLASASYRRAVELSPGFEDARDALRRLEDSP